MSMVVAVGLVAQQTPPTWSGKSDCCGPGGVAAIVIVLLIVLGLIALGWRRAADDRGLSYRRSRSRRNDDEG